MAESVPYHVLPPTPYQGEQRNPGLPAARSRRPQSRIPASVTLPPVKADLGAAIGRLRERVARLVERDGLDAHQVAANHLAWAVAGAEAAAACLDWAARTRDPHATLASEAAEEEALAFATGRGTDLGALDAGRLVAIHAGYRPTYDLGATDEHRLLRSSLRDFADRVVRPHAQAVHRQDLAVPDRLIRGPAHLRLPSHSN